MNVARFGGRSLKQALGVRTEDFPISRKFCNFFVLKMHVLVRSDAPF